MLDLPFLSAHLSSRCLNSWRRALYIFPDMAALRGLCKEIPWQQHGDLFRKGFSSCRRVTFRCFLPGGASKLRASSRRFLVPLLLLVWCGVLQVFNPASPHLVFGVLGMKLFF